jgi:hypothetical protein
MIGTVEAEGWYRDPYELHTDRWFSAGRPTALVSIPEPFLGSP